MRKQLSREQETARSEVLPTRVEGQRVFDRFASRITLAVSRWPFFVVSIAAATIWLVSGLLVDFSLHWLESGAVATGAVTFCIVGFLENAQRRSDEAVQRKLNAIADALAEFMEREGIDPDQVHELRTAIGLEQRTSTH